jgi:branched-subunit amino acid transport protein AzlD
MQTNQLIAFVATMSLATLFTRYAAFFLPRKVTELQFVKTANTVLPAAILTLLIIYSLKDSTYLAKPYGLPELVSLGVVIPVHIWKRNALLSIFLGTGIFMVLKQFVFV